MEFLESETLAMRLAFPSARWLGSAEGKEITSQICTGLKAVHSEGIVHRDLKPSNVMLSTGTDGRIRAVIMDFGIAQGVDMFSSEVRGTPAYLAPELWKGRPATIQSDLYALGVLLYEMSCGRKPFPEGTSWKERLQAVLPAPDISEPFRSAILRCLHPDPICRFQSAAELEESLQRVSRRMILVGATGLGVTGFSGAFLKEHFWPSSAVRLAVLPPSMKNVDTLTAPLITGFLHDLSYHMKTLHSVRRPLGVFSLTQTELEGVKTTEEAKTTFSAAAWRGR